MSMVAITLLESTYAFHLVEESFKQLIHRITTTNLKFRLVQLKHSIQELFVSGIGLEIQFVPDIRRDRQKVS